MTHDPFTLDLFGSSALSFGLGLGVTEFADYDPVAANDDDPDPTPPSPAPAQAARKVARPDRRQHGARTNPEIVFVQIGIQARPIRKLGPSISER
jgi:hypothetical protein